MPNSIDVIDGLSVHQTIVTNDALVPQFGAVTETAPATDTASSGLNGRLQRVAQRLTSLIALVPASLGQKTKANSLAVTLASDQDALPVSNASLPLPSGASTSAQIGEVQASPTANTVLDRLKALLTGIVLSAGSAIIGKVGIDQTTPGLTNGVQTKQYAGVPTSFAIQTSDQTVFTLAAGEIGFVQNLHTTALAVKKGASASTTSLSLILPGGATTDDGKGGPIAIDDWIGVVSVAAMSGSPRYVAWKQAA